jgi:hypothetical protein
MKQSTKQHTEATNYTNSHNSGLIHRLHHPPQRPRFQSHQRAVLRDAATERELWPSISTIMQFEFSSQGNVSSIPDTLSLRKVFVSLCLLEEPVKFVYL